jgi:HEAT repeat protein
MRVALILILSLFVRVGLAHSTIENHPGRSITSPEVKSNSYVSFNPDPGIVISMQSDSTEAERYPVQIGAFRNKGNAEALYNKMAGKRGIDAKIVFENGLYKVRLTRSASRKVAVNGSADKLLVRTSELSADSVDNIQRPTLAVFRDTTMPKAIFDVNASDTLEKNVFQIPGLFFINGDSPWIKRINYQGRSIGFVNALIMAITLSIFMMIALLLFILVNRRRMEKEESLHQYLMEKYQSLIIDYLYGNTAPVVFKAIASDNYRRQVLIDQMIDVSINLKGGEGNKLLNLYKYLGLDRDSIARAYDPRWHIKIKGFRELAFMSIKDANDAIYEALNSSNEILRMEAQIALVRLSDDNHFEFLSHLTTPFSLWEQITLHELIIQHNMPAPSFQKWLNSPNNTVVMFALRMIREFKQNDSEDKVREVLSHTDPLVRTMAVQVAGDLNMRSTLEPMKHMYKTQDYNTCLEIVKSMGKMPDLSMLGFLKLVLDKEDDVQLQIEATKAIENNGEEGVKALVKLMKSEYKNYNIIIRHVLDRRIY